MTCPCGQYDYIGETGSSLADRVKGKRIYAVGVNALDVVFSALLLCLAHRYHGNRIMHETFLGEKNIKLAYSNLVKSAE